MLMSHEYPFCYLKSNLQPAAERDLRFAPASAGSALAVAVQYQNRGQLATSHGYI